MASSRASNSTLGCHLHSSAKACFQQLLFEICLLELLAWEDKHSCLRRLTEAVRVAAVVLAAAAVGLAGAGARELVGAVAAAVPGARRIESWRADDLRFPKKDIELCCL